MTRNSDHRELLDVVLHQLAGGLGEAAAACRCGEDEDFVEVHCIEIRDSAIYDGDTTANFDKAIDQAHLSSEKGK